MDPNAWTRYRLTLIFYSFWPVISLNFDDSFDSIAWAGNGMELVQWGAKELT